MLAGRAGEEVALACLRARRCFNHPTSPNQPQPRTPNHPSLVPQTNPNLVHQCPVRSAHPVCVPSAPRCTALYRSRGAAVRPRRDEHDAAAPPGGRAAHRPEARGVGGHDAERRHWASLHQRATQASQPAPCCTPRAPWACLAVIWEAVQRAEPSVVHASLPCRVGSVLMQGITRFVPSELHSEADREVCVGGTAAAANSAGASAGACHCLQLFLTQLTQPNPMKCLLLPLHCRWRRSCGMPTPPSKICCSATGWRSTGVWEG